MVPSTVSVARLFAFACASVACVLEAGSAATTVLAAERPVYDLCVFVEFHVMRMITTQSTTAASKTAKTIVLTETVALSLL